MHRYLTDYILDITQNAFEANSNHVWLKISEVDRYFRFSIRDDGKGMDQDELTMVLDPYYTDGIKHSKRKVGLGIPFLAQATKETNSRFGITSTVGKGTEVHSSFDLCNVDTPPIGDIPGTLLALMSNPQANWFECEREIKTVKGTSSYTVNKDELIEVLGNLENASNLILLRDFLRNQEDSLKDYYVKRQLIF
ncbi:MAG: ATP-binding protein [Sphaerochaetaceae bacterium]|nr:ATP-binding protein [Sphaerochaetaceae bacterium]